MKEVFARTPDMSKIKVIVNEHDQPVGSSARELASVIGILVRKISVQYSDWRLVEAEKKDALWGAVKVIYGFMHSMSAVIGVRNKCALYTYIETDYALFHGKIRPNMIFQLIVGIGF